MGRAQSSLVAKATRQENSIKSFKILMVIGVPRCPSLALTGVSALVQLAADQAPIYPAEDHQKKLPSGLAALASPPGDHDPLMLKGTA